jgi:exosortase/archaeosortase family protein
MRSIDPPDSPHMLRRWWQAWYATKAPVLRYVIRFLGALGLLYAVSLSPIYQIFLGKTAETYAGMAHSLIQLLGGDSNLAGSTLFSGQEAIVTVLPLCTGFDYSWFLVAAIIAFPAPAIRKLPGVFLGVLALLFLNLLRVTSLYWTGVQFPRHFAFMHEQLWALVLNLVSVSLIVGWIIWVKRNDKHEA